VHSTDRSSMSRLGHGVGRLGVFVALTLGACSTTQRETPAPVLVAPPPKPAELTRSQTPLPPPKRVSDWDEYRLQAAQRIVAANESSSYMGTPPDQLLAIPVLEIELNADGGVRRIGVLRYPTQAKDTTQLAIDAVRRAAPFGDVSKLPRPWKFVETFLFDDDRHFKPRSLD